jgi:hypothetical protein
VSVEPDGEGEVISLTTTTGNYVAWGYASKNCKPKQVWNGRKYVWDFSGADAAALPELNDLLRASCYVRHTKSQVLSELPPKVRQDVEIAGDAEILKAYRQAEEDIVQFQHDAALLDRQYYKSLAGLTKEERREAMANHALNEARKAARAKVLTQLTKCRQLLAQAKLADPVALAGGRLTPKSQERLDELVWMGDVRNVAGSSERPHRRLWDGCFDLGDDRREEGRALIALGEMHRFREAC